MVGGEREFHPECSWSSWSASPAGTLSATILCVGLWRSEEELSGTDRWAVGAAAHAGHPCTFPGDAEQQGNEDAVPFHNVYILFQHCFRFRQEGSLTWAFGWLCLAVPLHSLKSPWAKWACPLRACVSPTSRSLLGEGVPRILEFPVKMISSLFPDCPKSLPSIPDPSSWSRLPGTEHTSRSQGRLFMRGVEGFASAGWGAQMHGCMAPHHVRQRQEWKEKTGDSGVAPFCSSRCCHTLLWNSE